MNAIPTKYKGIQFRSRLEARWAAMLDLLCWPWDYEPIDLQGYIPDFIVGFPERPLLVEVKPILCAAEFAQYEEKLEQSGWQHESLIVGAKLFSATDYACMSLGWLREIVDAQGLDKLDASNPNSGWWDMCTVGWCASHWGISHQYGMYNCRYCGVNEGNPLTERGDEVESLWREAGNVTQWRPVRR